MRSPPRSPGFTLLELLVVMFIVGIIAAMATLSVGVATREKGTTKEIDHLGDLLALASEEAVLRGREFGLTFYTRKYEFTAFDPTTGTWEPVGDDEKIFAQRDLPPESVLELEIDARAVKLLDEKPRPRKKSGDRKTTESEPSGKQTSPPDKDKMEAKEQNLPQIFILSSGDITPFTVHIRPAIGRPGIRLEVAESGSTKAIRDES